MLRLARAPVVDSVIRATRVDRPRAQRHGLALLLSLAAVLGGWWLRPLLGVSVPLVVFVPAVMVAAWFGGLVPGLLVTALTGAAAVGLFQDLSAGPWAASVIRPLAFLLIGGAASILGEVLHEARRRQERSLRRVARLVDLRAQLDDVVTALPEPLSVARMADIVLGQGRALLGARTGVLATLEEDELLRTASTVGYPPGAEAGPRASAEFDGPLAEARRLETPLLRGSVAALPLLLRGRVTGAIAFGFGEQGTLRETDLPVMQALAFQAALALESAHRYEREQSARRMAEDLGERQRFLAGANGCLAGSLDYEANLRAVCRLAVPAFAEGCLVHLRNHEGGLSLLAADHADAQRRPALEELGRGFAEAFWRIVASRRPELLPDAASVWMERARDERERALLERLELGSSLAVPLVARDRALGMVTFLTSRGGRTLGSEDLDLGRDLADRAAAAVDTALLLAEAQRLNRVKDEFLALLSHELRTPLGSALVWLELLRAEPLEAGPRRAAEMAQRSGRQLAELIDQLLDMSRAMSGKLSIEKQATDLAAVADAVMAAATPLAEAKGVRLEADIERGGERQWADPNRLKQALGNLVANAVKFTADGGTVRLGLEHTGSVARFQVQDTGVGIAREVLPFVFERFLLGDPNSTRAQGGLGLGLTIAQYIAEQHEGTLRAASEGPGRGSVFTLDLPFRPPPGLPAPGAVPPPGHPLSALRVLLVDDHRDLLHGIALGLQARGAEVTPVSSVREALAALAEFRPDVVVSDLAMPGEDGYTLIDQIRRLAPEAGGLIPAVAVSASAGPDDRLRALNAGYQVHVAKPVELDRLVATIERLVVPRPLRPPRVQEPDGAL